MDLPKAERLCDDDEVDNNRCPVLGSYVFGDAA